MEQIKVTYVPIVSLKNLSPEAILKDIHSGLYNKKPAFLNVSKGDPSLLKAPTLKTKQVYRYIDGANKLETVATEVGLVGDNIQNLPGICLYCRRYYDKLPYGICVRVIVDPLDGRKEYFVQDRRLCSPECSLGRVHDIKVSDGERDLYDKLTQEMLQHITGTKSVIKRANDYMLLEEHGGTETYEEWSSNHKQYTKLNSVTMTQIHREYKAL